MSICPDHGFYGGTSCTLCQLYGKGPMLAQAGTQYSVHDVYGDRKEWFVPDPELTMTAPTKEQLKDPKWWDENAPLGCKKAGVSYIGGKIWSVEFMPDGITAVGAPCNAEVRFIERPTTPPAPEWDGEGLPPVGFTDNDCELVGVEGFAEGFEVVAHKGVAAIVWGPYQDDPEGQVETLLACHFRPLRTKAQREREELSEAVEAALGKSPGLVSRESLTTHLFNLNVRKVAE